MENVFVIIEHTILDGTVHAYCASVHTTMESAKAHIMAMKKLLGYELYAESSKELEDETGCYNVHFRSEKRSGWYEVQKMAVYK